MAISSMTFESFAGDGVETDFTLGTSPVTGVNTVVHVDGVSLKPGIDYTVSGAILSFAAAPANGAEIDTLSAAGVIVETIADLKALSPDVVTHAILSDPTRSGQFAWVAGDFTSKATGGVAEAKYIASDGVAIGNGCWVRRIETEGDWPIEWFGIVAEEDGGGDQSALLNAAISWIKDANGGEGGGRILLPRKTFLISETVHLRHRVAFAGMGKASTFKATSGFAGAIFRSFEDLYVGDDFGRFVLFSDLTLDSSTCDAQVTHVLTEHHFNLLSIYRVGFVGKLEDFDNPPDVDVGHVGVWAKHTDAGNGANFLYHNELHGCDFNSLWGPACFIIEGDGLGSRRSNNWEIENCRFGNYRVAIDIAGIMNRVEGCCFNRNSNPIVPEVQTGTRSYPRIKFSDGWQNIVTYNWFENAAAVEGGVNIGDEALVMGVSNGLDTQSVMDCIGNIGLDGPDHIIEYSDYNGDQATRFSNTVCQIQGDVRATYPIGSKIRVSQGVDGYAEATVSNATFPGPHSNITVSTPVFTPNLIGIYRIDNATRVDSSNLTVPGNVTSRYPAGSTFWALEIAIVGPSYRRKTVSGVSYNAGTGLTTVTFAPAGINATLNRIFPAPANPRGIIEAFNHYQYPHLDVTGPVTGGTFGSGVGNQGFRLSSTTGIGFDIAKEGFHVARLNRSDAGTASLPIMSFLRGATALGGMISASSTTVAYTTSSDYRMKENVATMTGAVKLLKQLQPKFFTWKNNPDVGIAHGFLAHELQGLIPEAVVGEKDAVNEDGLPAYQGVDSSKLVPLLTGAVKELIERVETLEHRGG